MGIFNWQVNVKNAPFRVNDFPSILQMGGKNTSWASLGNYYRQNMPKLLKLFKSGDRGGKFSKRTNVYSEKCLSFLCFMSRAVILQENFIDKKEFLLV